jgi:hypothetical protein
MRTDSTDLNGTSTSAIGVGLNRALDAGRAQADRAVVETRLAVSARETEAVQRFRYEIYVDELHRYGDRADHDQRRLADPEDDTSWIWYATDGDKILASVRITWGGHGFSSRQLQQYRLGPFLDELPPEQLAVGERFMIRPSWRDGDILQAMSAAVDPLHRHYGVRVMFGACEPHLLSAYCAMNAPRPYAERNINHPDAGYLIPTITLLDGLEPLKGVTAVAGLPRCVEQALATTGAIRSPYLEDPDRYKADLLLALDAIGQSVFDGLTPDEVVACTARSIVIRCAEGDRVLKRGGAARNVYVVLDGALEVRDSSQQVADLGPGDVFGETAFLLGCPRTFDVEVLKNGTRLLAMSERTLRRLTADSPTAAAKLFANLATVLSPRLVSSW